MKCTFFQYNSNNFTSIHVRNFVVCSSVAALCCVLSVTSAFSAEKGQTRSSKEQQAELRMQRVEKEALKEPRVLMYDGMNFKELEKKVGAYESYRWNTAEYGVKPLLLNYDGVECKDLSLFPLSAYYMKPESWEYKNVDFHRPLPVSFSCYVSKKKTSMNLRLLDSVVSSDKTAGFYSLRNMYRKVPVRFLRYKPADNNESELYMMSYLVTNKWNSYEFDTGYMFGTFLDGYFDFAYRNHEISKFYLNMRDLFKMDSSQCVISRLALKTNGLDSFLGSADTLEECAEWFDEVVDTGKVQSLKRIRQMPRSDGTVQVDVDGWYEQFVMYDPKIYEWFYTLSKDVKADRTTKLLEYAKCNGIEERNFPINEYIKKHASKTNCNSVKKVTDTNLSSYYNGKEYLRFVYYYSQAGQSDKKDQHCFYPKVFSTKLESGRKEVKSVPGSNVFCATPENLEETLRQSYDALMSQFDGYAYESPIFIPVNYLKFELRNMNGILFPEIGNMGPKNALTKGVVLDEK